jgi:FkbM family methyltransferase
MKHFALGLARGTYSQHGEDQFLLKYFGDGYRGFYIDIGASHPFIISNTYLLSRNGWHGITAEPIPYLWRRHKWLRPRDVALNIGVSDFPGSLRFYQMVPAVLSTFDRERFGRLIDEGWQLRSETPIEVTTLGDLCRMHLDGASVDLLSIDVEGWDLNVLKGNDWSAIEPRLVICEVADDTRAEVDDFLAGKGYSPLKDFGCNRIYERRA